jgi:hypothetical protein
MAISQAGAEQALRGASRGLRGSSGPQDMPPRVSEAPSHLGFESVFAKGALTAQRKAYHLGSAALATHLSARLICSLPSRMTSLPSTTDEVAALRKQVTELQSAQKIDRVRRMVRDLQAALEKKDQEQKMEKRDLGRKIKILQSDIRASLQNEKRDRLLENEKRDREADKKARDH